MVRPTHRRYWRGGGQNRPNGPDLRFMQVNVQKKPGAHDAALTMAWDEGYHVALIQEPWVQWRDARRLTKTHRGFTHYTLTEDWSAAGPRVLTYV